MGGCSTKVTPAATHKAGTPLYGEQPAHWSEVATKEYQSNGFRAVKLARDDGVWQQLERFLELDDPQNLGRGRDMQQKAKQKYDQLRLLAAWRVQKLLSQRGAGNLVPLLRRRTTFSRVKKLTVATAMAELPRSRGRIS